MEKAEVIKEYTEHVDESFMKFYEPEHQEQVEAQCETVKFMNVRVAELSISPVHCRKVRSSEKNSELEASIQKHGILQSIVITENSDGLQVVAGVKRYLAAEALGLETVPCRFIKDATAYTSLAENLIRENLSPIELGEILGELKAKFNISHKDLAQQIGKSASTVSELLNLNDLPQSIKDQCYGDNKIPQRILVEIARLGDEKAMAEAIERFNAGLITDRNQVPKESRSTGKGPVSKFCGRARSIIKQLKKLGPESLGVEETEALKELQQLIEEKLKSLQAEAA